MLGEDYINKIRDSFNIGDKLTLENYCKRKEEGKIVQKTEHFVVIQFRHWKECFNWFELYIRAVEVKKY